MSGVVYDKSGVALYAAYNKAGASLQSVYDIGGNEIPFPEPVDPSIFVDIAVVTALPSISVSGIKQGACTDDTYIYQIVFDSSAYTSGKFIKYRISDGTYTTTTFDGSVNFGHGNDMAYNPNNNHIYVLCMVESGDVQELDTNFNYIATHHLKNANGEPYRSYRLCFDRLTNQFISGLGIYDTMLVFNQELEYVSTITVPPQPDSTGQGCETDGDFIYRLTYNPNYVDVLTIDGEPVKTINLPVSGEPESIMYNWSSGEFYIGRNVNSGLFSKVQLKA